VEALNGWHVIYAPMHRNANGGNSKKRISLTGRSWRSSVTREVSPTFPNFSSIFQRFFTMVSLLLPPRRLILGLQAKAQTSFRSGALLDAAHAKL
jgi:hypothetical protein